MSACSIGIPASGILETQLRPARRELARRASNGIEVALFWSKPTNRVMVEVFDASLGESFELEVDGSNALEAFYHPYAYAARCGRPYLAEVAGA